MSHFTTVETKIKDLSLLKRILKELNFVFEEAKQGQQLTVKGYQGHKTEADMVIHVSKSYDIGVRVTNKGVRFVADWWGVETTAGIEEKEFTQKIVQKYSYYKVIEELRKKGYTLEEEETKEDNSIHIKLRKWAA